MSAVLADLHAEFGWKSRFYSTVGGRYVLWMLRKEEKRLARGWTYEPPTFYERNEAVQVDASAREIPKLATPVVCRVPAERRIKPQVAAVAAGHRDRPRSQPEPLAVP